MSATAGVQASREAIQLWQAAPERAAQCRLEMARQYQDQFERLSHEFPNLRVARAQLVHQEDVASAQLLLAYVETLHPYMQRSGLDNELVEWCSDGLVAARRLNQNPGWLLLCLGGAQNRLGRWQEAEESFRAAREVSQGWDKHMYAQATLELGRLQLNRGDYRIALETLAEAEAILNDSNGDEGLAIARAEVAAYYLNRGELDQALTHYQQAEQHYRRSGAQAPSDHLTMMLGVVYRKKREYEPAVYYLEQLLARGESLKDRSTMAPAAHHLAWVYLNLGELEQARHYCGQAMTLYEEMQDPRGASDAYEQLGMILLAEGRAAEAIAQLERSLAIRRQLGNQHGAASSLRHLALAHWQAGQRFLACRELVTSMRIYWRLGVLSRHRLYNTGRELYEWLSQRRKWTV